MYDIITIGEILCEILADKVNQPFDKPGTLLGPFPSGAPAICIDQSARMGASTAIIAKVGKDDFAKLNIERLRSSGVDVQHIIEVSDNTTGVAFVTYFDDGSRQFIFHFTKAACGELCPDDVNEDIIKNSKVLHIMGCSITGSPTMGEAIMKAIRIARRNNTKISFDPNIRPELLSGKISDYYCEIIESSDILLCGKSELSLMYGSAEQAVTELLTKRERIVVVKDGSRGTSVYSRDEAFMMPVYPSNELDPTGAGDSFDGTFLALLCQGADLKTACDFACAAGACAVAHRGPMEGNSFRSDLELFINMHGARIATDIESLYKR